MTAQNRTFSKGAMSGDLKLVRRRRTDHCCEWQGTTEFRNTEKKSQVP